MSFTDEDLGLLKGTLEDVQDWEAFSMNSDMTIKDFTALIARLEAAELVIRCIEPNHLNPDYQREELPSFFWPAARLIVMVTLAAWTHFRALLWFAWCPFVEASKALHS